MRGRRARSVHAAFISGPTYDPLYERLEAFTEETGIETHVAFTGDHPSLNRHLAACDAAPYDLVSTHSKYAPSQLDFLAPLDGLLGDEALEDFEPRLLDLACINGQLYGVPRLVDVRLLHYRTDLLDAPPETWDDLLATCSRLKVERGGFAFAFPGRDSGLFGTFYELAEMGGARLFPDGSLVPDIENDGGAWALDLLRMLYREKLVPPAVPGWHFDEVHRAFRDGTVAMIGDWPASYGLHKQAPDSRVAGCFAVCPYPTGPSGHSLAYGGAHTFALTKHGRDKPEALALLQFLTAPDQQYAEAQSGALPPRRSVRRCIQAETQSPQDRRRWQALEQVVRTQVLLPPKLRCYPQIEAVICKTVQQCFLGERAPHDALAQITRQIESMCNAN